MQQALAQDIGSSVPGLDAMALLVGDTTFQTADQGTFAINTVAATSTASEEPDLVTLTLVVAASDISAALPGIASELAQSTYSATPLATPTTASSASPSIKVAVIPSLAIKPIVASSGLLTLTSTATVSMTAATLIPSSTPSNGNDSGLPGFLRSLSGSPVNIALTVLVCIGILVLIIASIAFFVRRARKHSDRRRIGVAGGISVDRTVGRYSDIGSGSVYDEDARSIYKVSLPGAADMSEKHSYSQAYHPSSNSPLPASNIIDLDNTETLENEDWNREMLQERRRSSLDMSLVQHLRFNQPFATPSVFHESSSASQVFNYAATAASSPYLEPPIGPQLRSTYLGSFSASVPTGPRNAPQPIEATSGPASMLQVPARPNRPASLTRSFTHAVECEWANNPPSPPQYVAVPLNTSTIQPVQSAWGVRTISQVFSASADAVGSLLAAAPQSPSYDEEKADRFTALPDPITARRPSTRWGSFASTASNAPDRKIYQQMPSRFSVTTLGTVLTNSPTQSVESASAYGDWQVRSAQRQHALPRTAPRRAIPELIAQREATPPTSSSGSSATASAEVDNVTASTPGSTSGQWADTAPLITSTRPTLDRLASVRSTATVQSSIYSLVDPEEDGYGLTSEEQGEMKKLIQKRRAAAMAAR